MWVVTFFVLSGLLGSPQQSASPGVTVAGVVQDQTGAVLAGATVDLAAGGRVVRSVVTDGRRRLSLRWRRSGELRAARVSYVGIISSPLFGTPVSARSARQFQFSLGYKF